MSRNKVVETAKKEVGTSENPANSNRTKYGKWYGLDGHPWCAMFVSWVFDQAGVRLKVGQTSKGFHHCQSAHNIWKQKQRLTSNPQKGDIVLFDWQNNGWADHTGIFVKWENAAKTQFTCLEGNTSVNNNSNGGLVMERKRNKSTVKAFVCPEVFDDVVLVKEDKMTINDRGSEVAEVQKMLNDIGYPTKADGWFGVKTKASVLAFQKDNLMAETGEVDAATLGAIQEEHQVRSIAKSKLSTGTFLRIGDKGYEVTLLQEALNQQGANPKLVVDGDFGRKTSTALKEFQRINGLIVDGIAGPQSFVALGMM